MKLKLIKTMNHTAFEFAISHDKTKFATISDRMVRVYSWPELEVIEKFRIGNVSSMVFLEDNQSILLLNTSGKLFLWDGEVLNKLGKWPVSKWVEHPLIYFRDNVVVWSGLDGIWKYNVAEKRIQKIYSTEYDKYFITGFEKEVIRVICGQYGFDKEQEIEFVKITIEGDVLERKKTERIRMRKFKGAAWGCEENIVLSTIEGKFTALDWGEPKSYIYLFNSDTTIHKKKELAAHESGECYYGNGMFILRCQIGDSFIFYDATNLEEIYRLDKDFICAESRANRPETIAFITDKDILIGCLEKMYVFHIEND